MVLYYFFCIFNIHILNLKIKFWLIYINRIFRCHHINFDPVKKSLGGKSLSFAINSDRPPELFALWLKIWENNLSARTLLKIFSNFKEVHPKYFFVKFRAQQHVDWATRPIRKPSYICGNGLYDFEANINPRNPI